LPAVDTRQQIWEKKAASKYCAGLSAATVKKSLTVQDIHSFSTPTACPCASQPDAMGGTDTVGVLIRWAEAMSIDKRGKWIDIPPNAPPSPYKPKDGAVSDTVAPNMRMRELAAKLLGVKTG